MSAVSEVIGVEFYNLVVEESNVEAAPLSPCPSPALGRGEPIMVNFSHVGELRNSLLEWGSSKAAVDVLFATILFAIG